MRSFIISFLFLPFISVAQLKMAPIFTDHMVLQREQPVVIYGTGVPGMQVTVTFSGDEKSSIIRRDSTWQVEFTSRKTNPRPGTIAVSSGGENISLMDILIGDVWVCIGQSNMEWPMSKEKHFKEALAQVDQPLLRLYNPTYAGKNIYGTQFQDSTLQRLTIEDFYKGQWQTSDSNSIKTMSAVGYYFGRSIIDEIKVPLGLIHLAVGGAPIETFIDRETMLHHKRFGIKVKGNWLNNPSLPVWVRQRGHQNVGSADTPLYIDHLGPNHAFKPGFAYASGIEPIISFPVKGILWYQGESNAQEPERVSEYADLLKLMVEDYRRRWKQPSLPFYFVQLSSIDTLHYQGHLWPAFRNEQRNSLEKIKNTGMAVSSDIGSKNDVHPTNKKDVGERLARWALNKTYKKRILPSGPLPVKATYSTGKVIITFQYAGDGLKTTGNKALKGFSIDSKEHIHADLDGKTVMIRVSEKPSFIYYGWEPFTDANLVNSSNLPASTFKLSVQ